MSGQPLAVGMTVARSAFDVTVAFELPAGQSLAVLGSNGSGKSTLLSVIAGILPPDSGFVRVGKRTLTEMAPGRRVQIPPEHRRIGLMGQQPLLFPHLTAAENIAFGPRSQGADRHAARAVAHEWLERLGMEGFGDRKPRQLSGGQAQRVALARALAAGPELLLLDEPLGALDVTTVSAVRQLLRTHLRELGVTAVVITHDVLDAAVLADRAIVLDEGRVVDEGEVSRVLTAPKSTFGASLAGLNLLAGTVTEGAGAGHPVAVTTASGGLLTGLAAAGLHPGQEVAAVFPPAAVALFLDDPHGSPRNQWPGSVRMIESGTGTVRVHVEGRDCMVAELTAAAVAELGLGPASPVVASVKATEILVHPR